MQIADQCVAYLQYVLTDADGKQLDASKAGEPLAYLHGAQNIVPGLEKALTGKSKGEKLSVTVQPEEAYGKRDESLVQEVPRAMFQGVDKIEAGMQFQADSNHGPRIVLVTAVDEENVTVDGNHALAGQVLNFAVEITDVRAATDEEKQHGHVHGAGGHAH